MRYLKSYSLFENTTVLNQEQIDWLNKCTQGTWELNPKTGMVDIKGDIPHVSGFYCMRQWIKDFKGIKFGVVEGNFNCSSNRLTSLEGSPRKVGWDFSCAGNKLQSLIGGPEIVGFDPSIVPKPAGDGGNFNCSYNQLTSLVGSPKEIKNSYICWNNQITSLEGVTMVEDFSCYSNPVSVETLELIFNKMKSGLSYLVALVACKNDIPERDWNLLDKTGLTPDLEKGASTLGRFGVFDS